MPAGGHLDGAKGGYPNLERPGRVTLTKGPAVFRLPAELAGPSFDSRLFVMSPFPRRERKADPRTVRPDAGKSDEPTEPIETPIEFQPESGALAPREPVDEAQLDHDRREDL
jgi:hypothetical protein